MEIGIDLQYLLFLQNLRLATGGIFDEFFNGMSKVAVDVLPFLPFLIFLCVSKKWGYRILTSYLGADLLNGVVKLTVCAYRPWIRSDLIEPAGDSKVDATGYSFPSGHTVSASSDDIVMKEELEALDGACGKLRIVHVLSGDEPGWTGEKGFLTAELIKKYSAEDTTYFICGPQVMYQFLRGEVAKLEVPARRVRFEVFGQVKDIAVYEGYPRAMRDETFELTVVRGISEVKIPAKACESIVVALERAGIRIETGCRSGECGFCRTKVLSGDYFVCPEGDGRREADKDFNYVHACAAYPLSDMKIKIPIL